MPRYIKIINPYFPVADPGYCTATESLYESGLSDNCREKNEGNITDRDSITLNDSGTHESIVSAAVICHDVVEWFTLVFLRQVPVAVPWHRRATPEEDMVWTLAGIKALIEQQRQIISCIANNTDKIGQTSVATRNKHITGLTCPFLGLTNLSV